MKALSIAKVKLEIISCLRCATTTARKCTSVDEWSQAQPVRDDTWVIGAGDRSYEWSRPIYRSRLSDIIFVITPICSGTTWAVAWVERYRAFPFEQVPLVYNFKSFCCYTKEHKLQKNIDPVHNVLVQKACHFACPITEIDYKSSGLVTSTKAHNKLGCNILSLQWVC